MKKIAAFIKREKKQILFRHARRNAGNRGFLLIIIIGCGQSGKAILQVSVTFFRALSKYF